MYSDKMLSVKQQIEGPSLDDCKNHLFKKYGTEYQIVDIKTTLKSGFLGMFQKEMVTVVYVVNNKRFDSPAPRENRPLTVPTYSSQTLGTAKPVAERNDFTKNRDELINKTNGNVASALQLGVITKKLDEVSRKLDNMENTGSQREEHPTITKIEELLKLNEFTSSYIKSITEKIRNNFSLDELDDFDKVQAQVVDWIGESIKIDSAHDSSSPRVIIIVGPTGVGKTTTIAKLAAIEKIKAKKKKQREPKIRLITIDRMRVAAVEQLEHWGELLEIPVDKADTSDDMKDLVRGYKDNGQELDFLLIDTSGYSPNDYENIGKMRTVLNVPGLQADIYLAIAASTKARDLETILRNYEPFNFKSVIITKLDETSSYGNVLSVLSEKNKAISWVTDGQYVLHYIQRANPVRFLRYLEGFHSDKAHLESKFGSLEEDSKD